MLGMVVGQACLRGRSFASGWKYTVPEQGKEFPAPALGLCLYRNGLA